METMNVAVFYYMEGREGLDNTDSAETSETLQRRSDDLCLFSLVTHLPMYTLSPQRY